MGYGVVKNQAPSKHLCFCRWNCNKIGAANAIRVEMPQNSRYNFFIRKQITNKVSPDIYRCLKVGGNVRLVFRGVNQNTKG